MTQQDEAMEIFIGCGWEVSEYRTWSDSQGPFLEGLDFFFNDTIKTTKGRKLIGRDYNGNDISLIETGEMWFLFVKRENGEVKLSSRKLETIEMVEAFWKAHPRGKYNYERSVYIKNQDKVEIGCSFHGTFFQEPWKHKRGVGCKPCGSKFNRKTLTTENFIERSRNIHGELYDYSKSIYTNYKSELIIICSKHGEFLQKVQVHLQGSGCPECAKMVIRNQGTTYTFIEKARMVHGNKYDYSKVEYVSALDKVGIICPDHGLFQQVASNHLSGRGCPKDNKSCFKTLEEFVKIAKVKHLDKYDYSRVIYKKLTDLVEILCPVKDHGSFWIRATDHISCRGIGCQKCAWKGTDHNSFVKLAEEIHEGYYSYSKTMYIRMKTQVVVICPRHGEFFITPSDHIRKGRGCKNCSLGNLTQEEFIEQSINVFGTYIFDYSRVNYISQTTEVVLRCIKHNWTFVQKPVIHLRGKGCLKCAHDQLAKLDVRTDEWFRKEAVEAHGLKYSYSKSHFKGMTKMITIICPKHGEFDQKAGAHLQGCGCSKCSSSKGETKVRVFLEMRGIIFEEQKTFVDCRDKGQLRYDFYIHQYNLLIEYDGAQHFYPVECWGGEKALEGVRRRDKIKNKYAKKNGIKLLRIRYDECVEQKIDNFLEKMFSEIESNKFKIMERFEECGWSRDGDKVWTETQGSFLEGLDFFIKPTSEKEIEGIIIPLGKDAYDETVVLANLFDTNWVLATKKGNVTFPLKERDSETLDMVQSFWKVHQKGAYSYELAVNTTSKGKVTIICPHHGEFLQQKYSHQNGAGCKACSSKRETKISVLTTKEFIRRGKERFGDKLDYSKTVYQTMKIPVIIICPQHGEFSQLPKVHLVGRGCPKCSSAQKKTIDNARRKFKERGGEVHNYKYDYDKSEYKGSKIKLIIICPTHGEFSQTPDDHINKKAGCPSCKRIPRFIP